MSDALSIVYLNGSFQNIREAHISPLDRGFLFGDAVYEVIPVHGGKPLLLKEHLARLERSLSEIRMVNPHTPEEWSSIVKSLIEQNSGGNLGIYIQISRGADTGRDHAVPDGIDPTVFGMASRIAGTDYWDSGVTAITLPDLRWARCDIKSTALLANVLARQQAVEAGADDAILIRDGYVTEASVSSVIIVEGGVLVTRNNGPELLPGTTRQLVLTLATEAGLSCREEAISEERLRTADELWLMSAGRGVVPVTHLDGSPVGDGKPGPVWNRVKGLISNYIDNAGSGIVEPEK
ncbi:MAG: D-amino acid aminotransferase [Gammaproteobacteria bacterium]|nr:D-amino acid aminotransferase [Gammaproteobacteria bacterium]